LTRDLYYPERENCLFSQDPNKPNEYGNLCRREGYLQARFVQSQSLQLPVGSIVCGLNLEATTQELQYDDFIAITIDMGARQYLLMASNNYLLRHMPLVQGDVYLWDFEAVRGQPYEFEGGRFCIGGTGICEFPPHDKRGHVSYKASANSIATLSAHLSASNDFKVSLIATGDNDDGDCWHTPLNLNATVTYVVP
jgi:hypothetical protein